VDVCFGKLTMGEQKHLKKLNELRSEYLKNKSRMTQMDLKDRSKLESKNVKLSLDFQEEMENYKNAYPMSFQQNSSN
jgi:hypothetical protein